jgi:hypothetical protein
MSSKEIQLCSWFIVRAACGELAKLPPAKLVTAATGTWNHPAPGYTATGDRRTFRFDEQDALREWCGEYDCSFSILIKAPPTFREFIFKTDILSEEHSFIEDIRRAYEGPAQPPDNIKKPEQLEKLFDLTCEDDDSRIYQIWEAYTAWFKKHREKAVWE